MSALTLNIKKLKINTFEASRDMASCLDFSEGYFKILADQGMNSTYMTSHTWMQTEGIYGVLVSHDEKIIGGIILCVPNGNARFPYEELTEPAKRNNKKRIPSQPEGTCELFALWNSTDVAGWGLSYILIKSGLALAYKLGLKKALYLAAEYNMRLIDKLGFQVEHKDGLPVFYTFQESSLKTKIYLNYFFTEDDRFARNQKEEIRELANSVISHKLETVLSKKLDIEYNI